MRFGRTCAGKIGVVAGGGSVLRKGTFRDAARRTCSTWVCVIARWPPKIPLGPPLRKGEEQLQRLRRTDPRPLNGDPTHGARAKLLVLPLSQRGTEGDLRSSPREPAPRIKRIADLIVTDPSTHRNHHRHHQRHHQHRNLPGIAAERLPSRDLRFRHMGERHAVVLRWFGETQQGFGGMEVP